MLIDLPFDTNKTIMAEASVLIDVPQEQAFEFIAENFFENYQKWAPEIIELEPLDEHIVRKGVKGRQVRLDNDETIESIFEVTEYQPFTSFIFQGLNAPYKQTYLALNGVQKNITELKFKFELLEVDLFMRPFAKLIQAAMEDGVEATVLRIEALLKPKAVISRKRNSSKQLEKNDALRN